MSAEKDLAAILVRDEGARAEESDFLSKLMLDQLQWPAEGGPAVVINSRNGQVRAGMTPADLINEMRAAFPFCFGGGPLPPKHAPAVEGARTFAPGTMTAKALAEHQATKAQQNNASDDWPNPWAANSLNLTRQALLTKNNPARAAELRASAEK